MRTISQIKENDLFLEHYYHKVEFYITQDKYITVKDFSRISEEKPKIQEKYFFDFASENKLRNLLFCL